MVRIYGVTKSSGSGGSGGSSGNTPSVQLSGLTQNNNSVRLTSDGSGLETQSNIVIIPSNKTALLTIQIVARTEASPHKTASWNISGMVKRENSVDSVSIVGFSPVSTMGDNELQNIYIQLSEHQGYGGLSIQCTGIVDYTVIKWAATVTLTEV